MASATREVQTSPSMQCLPRWEEIPVLSTNNRINLWWLEFFLSLTFLMCLVSVQVGGEIPLARSGHVAVTYKRQMYMFGTHFSLISRFNAWSDADSNVFGFFFCRRQVATTWAACYPTCLHLISVCWNPLFEWFLMCGFPMMHHVRFFFIDFLILFRILHSFLQILMCGVAWTRWVAIMLRAPLTRWHSTKRTA